MHPVGFSQLIWVVLLCSPPILIALAFALRSHRPPDIGTIRIGNPMFKPTDFPLHQEAVLQPLLHLTRTQSDADLRALILGLRHMPLSETAFILRRYQHSTDPELQLYSQCILQEKQERLQGDFTRFIKLAGSRETSHVASCIESGLNLMASPLTPGSEQAAVLRKLQPHVAFVESSGMAHPRAVFAAAKFCLLLKEVDRAADLRTRLPVASPLWDSLTALLEHHTSILRPPPPLTTGYTIH
jgi:hypothetical protein